MYNDIVQYVEEKSSMRQHRLHRYSDKSMVLHSETLILSGLFNFLTSISTN